MSKKSLLEFIHSLNKNLLISLARFYVQNPVRRGL